MYYEEYSRAYRRKNRPYGGRRKKRRSQGCGGFLLSLLLRLIAFLLILVVSTAGILYIIPPSFVNIEQEGTDLALTDGLPSDRVNVLLLGLDELRDASQRSDCMIIASVGYRSLRLVSVMRDTMVNIPGVGMARLNSAYAHGGAEMTMRCINETFGLNITRYIAVDYKALVKLVDAVGGVELEITPEELTQMNKNVGNSARVFKKLGYDAQPMSQSGSVRLNGLFALGYARIRKIDSDYMRTYRQRKLISALCARTVKRLWDPLLYKNLSDIYRASVDTNLSLPALISVGEKMLLSVSSIEETRTPQDGYMTDNGTTIRIDDPAGNASVLRSFLYG